MRQTSSRLGCRLVCTSLLLAVAVRHTLSAASGSHPSKPPPQAARLESVLYQLTQAPDATAFARAHDIALVDGRVRVIIELQEGSDLVPGPDVAVESRYHHLVRVLTPIQQLLPISQQQNVKFVRLPRKLVANE